MNAHVRSFVSGGLVFGLVVSPTVVSAGPIF